MKTERERERERERLPMGRDFVGDLDGQSHADFQWLDSK